MSLEQSTKKPREILNAIQNKSDGKMQLGAKEEKAVCENMKRAIKKYISLQSMRPSRGLFWFLFKENIHFLFTDFKKYSGKKKNTLNYVVQKSFKIPLAIVWTKGNAKISLCIRKFLFLPYLWQSKITNQNHRIVRVRCHSTLWQCP